MFDDGIRDSESANEIREGTYRIVGPPKEYVFGFDHPAWADGKMVASVLSSNDGKGRWVQFAFVLGQRVAMFKKFSDEVALREALQDFLSLDDDGLLAAKESLLQLTEKYAEVTGACFMCGHALKIPDSIHRGLGPVCARKEGVA